MRNPESDMNSGQYEEGIDIEYDSARPSDVSDNLLDHRSSERPPGIASFGLSPDGVRYATANAWSGLAQNATFPSLKQFVDRNRPPIYCTVSYQGNTYNCYREDDIQTYLDRRQELLENPLFPLNCETPIIREDGQQDLVGSESYWRSLHPLFTHRLISTFGQEPYRVVSWGKRELKYWLRSQVEEFCAVQTARYMSGEYLDPRTGVQLGTIWHWKDKNGRGYGFIEHAVTSINAVVFAPPSDAPHPELKLYSAEAVMAGVESRSNLIRSATELTPDPTQHTIVGSIAVWAHYYGVTPEYLSKKVWEKNVPVTRIGQRVKAYILTQEAVEQAWPEATRPARLQLRSAGTFIDPDSSERYTNEFDIRARPRLEALGVPKLDVMNSQRKPQTYYHQALGRACIRGAKVPEPVTEEERLLTTAEIHKTHVLKPMFDELRRQVEFPIGTSPVVLSKEGTVETEQGTLAPKVAILSQVKTIESKEQRIQFERLLEEARPVTLQDVTWPLHWKGLARLWLYDMSMILEQIELLQDAAAIEDALGVDQIIDETSQENQLTPPQVTNQSPAPVKTDEEHRLDNQQQIYIQKKLAQEQLKLKHAREAVERAASRDAQHQKFQDRVDELEEQHAVEFPSKSYLDPEGFHNTSGFPSGEVFATPRAWVERFRGTFRQLTLDSFYAWLDKDKIDVYRDKKGNAFVAEREVLYLLLSFLP